MKQHDRFLELLARRQELSESEEKLLERHLTECEECSRLSAAYREQSALISSLPLVAAPSSLRPAVLSAIRETPARRWSWAVPPASLLLAPTAAAVLIIIVALAQNHHASRPSALKSPPPSPSKRPAKVVRVQRRPVIDAHKKASLTVKPHKASKDHLKPSLPLAPSTVAQNIVPTRSPLSASPTKSTLAASGRGRDLSQTSSSTARSTSATHPKTAPPQAAPTPSGRPSPQPTSGPVILAGPPQAALKPLPPVRISTPTPQPVQPVAGVKPTPIPTPNP